MIESSARGPRSRYRSERPRAATLQCRKGGTGTEVAGVSCRWPAERRGRSRNLRSARARLRDHWRLRGGFPYLILADSAVRVFWRA